MNTADGLCQPFLQQPSGEVVEDDNDCSRAGVPRCCEKSIRNTVPGTESIFIHLQRLGLGPGMATVTVAWFCVHVFSIVSRHCSCLLLIILVVLQ